MPVILFHPRFHARILDGTKRQTIRAPRKRPIRPGRMLGLRGWSGAPYRTKQFTLLVARCTAVEPVWIDPTRHGLAVELAGRKLSKLDVARFAVADGFHGVGDMRAWWTGERKRTGPFEGVVIYWEPLES